MENHLNVILGLPEVTVREFTMLEDGICLKIKLTKEHTVLYVKVIPPKSIKIVPS